MKKIMLLLASILIIFGSISVAAAEDTLGFILDSKYGAGNYQEVTSTDNYTFADGGYIVTALLVDKQSSYTNPTGWYEADSLGKHELFSNPPIEVGTSQSFNPGEEFGMYINSSGTYYSEASQNGGTKRAKLFTISGGYVLAFEDGTDWDYQDIVVELKGEGLNLIPEFPTVALPVAAILGLVFIFGRKKEGL